MSFFQTPDTEERASLETPEPSRSKFTELGGRMARWFAGLDDEREDWPEHDPLGALEPGLKDGPDEAPPGEPAFSAPEPQTELDSDQEPARFELAPFGYNRVAVDEHLRELELELEELRGRQQVPMSITEELERIGEQTASILVVAHDKANETTRLAHEQAERCIADAASNAVQITDKATRRLREIDEETDQVWRERERLLDDVRTVSTALATLADDAAGRFPAEDKLQATQAIDVLAQVEGFEAVDASAEAAEVDSQTPFG